MWFTWLVSFGKTIGEVVNGDGRSMYNFVYEKEEVTHDRFALSACNVALWFAVRLPLSLDLAPARR